MCQDSEVAGVRVRVSMIGGLGLQGYDASPPSRREVIILYIKLQLVELCMQCNCVHEILIDR